MRAREFGRMLLRGAATPILLIAASGPLAAQNGAAVTYAKHVAPILQEKCQVCHQPNSIAPMSLLTYDEAKLFAPLIKSRVSARTMPPWHLDKTVGIQEYQNDRSLTDREIETLVRWADAGAPLGDPKDLPPPVTFPDPNRWQLADQFGSPDLVLKSPPFTLAAHTQDKWYRPLIETGITEPRWVRAIEVKPSYPEGRKIVHHVLTFLEQEEQGIRKRGRGAAQRRALHGVGRRQGG
jgi:hypothetical protein